MTKCAQKKEVFYSEKEAKKAVKATGGYYYHCGTCKRFHRTRQNPKLWQRLQNARETWEMSYYLKKLGYDK